MDTGDTASAGWTAAREQVVRYVAALEAALAGSDPALRHDALVDAETHLRSAIDGGVPVDRAIADFGTPEEVARAYLNQDSGLYGWRAQDAPTRTPHSASSPSAAVPATPTSVRQSLASRIPVLGIWIDRRAWGALVYFGAVGFLLSLAYFIWSVTLGSLVLGLAPLIIGVPLLVLLLGSARALCLFEGKVVEALLGVRMPRRVQPVEGADSVGFWQRILCWLRDVRSWLSLAYLLGNFFVSVCTFAITISLCAVSVALIGAGIGSLLGIPTHFVSGGDADSLEVHMLWWTLQPDANGVLRVPTGAAIAMTAVGLGMATATLWLMRGLGWVYGHVVQAIQVARPQPAGVRAAGARPPGLP